MSPIRWFGRHWTWRLHLCFEQNIFDTFYSEVEELNNNHDYVILLGDFNARTSNLTDVNEIDNALFDFADIDASSVFDTDVFQNLNVNGMSYEQLSQDKQTNRTGMTLIYFC